MRLQPGWRFFQQFFLYILAGVALFGQPTTSRISDTIYLANGERFTGFVQIEWQSFVTPKAPIAPDSKLVRVVDGLLEADRVPTRNLGYTAYYRVRYFRSGRVQYVEYWDVPSSASPLTVAAVRMVAPPSSGQTTDPGISLPLAQSDVENLSDDLADRPVKGPNFFPSRTVYVNTEGALEAISGSPTDCVRVDGTAVPCGSGDSAVYLVEGEVPTGVVNGLNQVFTLSAIPGPPESLQIYRNGILQKQGLDYTLSGSIVSFAISAIPQTDDVLLAFYRTFQTSNPPVNGSGTLPQVVCGLPGSSTSSLTLVDLGSCNLGSSLLQAGDRLEILFDFALTGGTPDGFQVELLWNGSPILSRSFVAGDLTASGSARVAMGTTTRQYSTTSFGLASAQQLGSGTLPVPGATFPVTIRGRLTSNPAAQLTLTSYIVTRYPAVVGQ